MLSADQQKFYLFHLFSECGKQFFAHGENNLFLKVKKL